MIYRRANFTSVNIHLLQMTNEANESSTVWEGSICHVVKEKNLIVKSVYLQVSVITNKHLDEKLQVWSSARNIKTDLQNLN